MNKHNFFYIGIIVFSFMFFCLYLTISNRTYDVIDIRNFKEICIDFNKNGVADDSEYIQILNEYNDITSVNNIEKYNINQDYIPLIEYLTNKFLNDNLLNKKVQIKINKRNNIIYVDNKNFNKMLYNSGFLFKNDSPVNPEAFKKLLSYIDKCNYKIYNLKSKKYHDISCKYGKIAHNSIYIPKNQLPRDADLCKFCANNCSAKNSINHNIKLSLIYNNNFIKVILTDYTNKLNPDKFCKTDICKELIRNINNSQKSIDIAIYGYDRVPSVENAIKKAINRGVKVRLVRDVDSKNSNIYPDTDYFSNLIKNYNSDYAPPNLKDPTGYTNSIMHNKFFIFDNNIVMTGSANLSSTDMSGFNTNAVIIINSPNIANIYTQEFNQMYSGNFHNLKNKIPNKTNIKVDNSFLSVYFSPIDKTIDSAIIPLINNAKKFIYIPTFLITNKKVSNSLILAKNRGVDVKIIIDATNAKNTYSTHEILRNNNIKVKVENYAGKLHSKSLIIDDIYTVIGSMNLSKNGELKNDENLIIIKDPNIAKFYKLFFEYLWSKISDFWLVHNPSAESINSIGSCSDGIDNDYDGLIDSADEGCKIK